MHLAESQARQISTSVQSLSILALRAELTLATLRKGRKLTGTIGSKEDDEQPRP